MEKENVVPRCIVVNVFEFVFLKTIEPFQLLEQSTPQKQLS